MKQRKSPYRFLLSGGGTGGHIYPALAIAQELQARFSDAEFLFVGALGKMEMEKVPRAGFSIQGLPVVGFERSLSINNLKFPVLLLKSLVKARKIIKQFQPDLVIGTGGFASGPVVYMAQNMDIPTAIQDQNSFPGFTNRKLGSKAKRIFVAYDGMEKYFPKPPLRETGNPIRAYLFENLPNGKEAKTFFGLDPEKPTVLSIGGSLGSRTLNQVWQSQNERLLENGYQLIWQTGSLEFDKIPDEIKSKTGIACHEFIYEMKQAYAAADIVISRAGAIAISELQIVGKPIILVPFPFAAEDHQTKNAQALVNHDAALMVSDAEAQTKLVPLLMEVLSNPAQQTSLSKHAKDMAKPEATRHIVDELIEILK